MAQLRGNDVTETAIADPRWKDLYKIGGIFSVISLVIVVLAIVAFFIWPYSPGIMSTADTFTAIQNDRLGGLMALDFFFLMGTLCSILIYLALYAALNRVNESYALIALVLGLISAVSLIPARPIVEILSLSDLLAAAATEAERSQYLAAGEALLTLFNGTAWMVTTVFAAISGLISATLMLRSHIFSKATSYVGIISNITALGFFLPGAGPILLFIATFGGLIWLFLLAPRFFKLGKKTA